MCLGVLSDNAMCLNLGRTGVEQVMYAIRSCIQVMPSACVRTTCCVCTESEQSSEAAAAPGAVPYPCPSPAVWRPQMMVTDPRYIYMSRFPCGKLKVGGVSEEVRGVTGITASHGLNSMM